jgi:four helix bundle protein
VSRDHRKIRAFQLADELVVAVYRGTRSFPREELFGLTSQVRRASISVAANIVEGSARSGHREFIQFLNMAFGSLREVGYYIDLSVRLGYLSAEGDDQLRPLYDETARVLSGLLGSLTRRGIGQAAAKTQDKT